MTSTQINQELENVKVIMDNLLSCVKAGQLEFYAEYIDLSAYYLKLMQVKPDHDFKLV